MLTDFHHEYKIAEAPLKMINSDRIWGIPVGSQEINDESKNVYDGSQRAEEAKEQCSLDKAFTEAVPDLLASTYG